MHPDVAELAPQLLAVADETGLPGLRGVAVDWIVQNFDRAAAASAFSVLSRDQMALLAGAACAHLKHYESVVSVGFWPIWVSGWSVLVVYRRA